MDVGGSNSVMETNLINQIRAAVPKGIVLFNYPSDDGFNPLDRQIEVYTYIKLQDVDSNLDGIVKLRVLCRLSVSNGMLSLRTIDKNFIGE